MPVEIDYLGEGVTDDIIARRVILHCGAVPGTSYRTPAKGNGKANVDRRLGGLNAGARFKAPVLVVRDLDDDAPCAPELVHRLLPEPDRFMALRICVHSAEAWLMADRTAYARYCGVPVAWVPDAPETQARLKDTILAWTERDRSSRFRRFMAARRKAAVPDWSSLGEWQSSFAEELWDIHAAADSNAAPSLERAIGRVRAIVASLS